MDENLAKVIVAVVISGTIIVSMLSMVVARAFASRRRREVTQTGMDRVEERLTRIEQAVDAIATEIERVAEAQRFTSRLLAEGRPAGHEAAPPPIVEQAVPAERRR